MMINTLAFLRRDFTVKPSVSKGPCWRSRFGSRRGDVAVAIICCRVLESVSILHKWLIRSFFSLLFIDNDHYKNALPRNNPLSLTVDFFLV